LLLRSALHSTFHFTKVKAKATNDSAAIPNDGYVDLRVDPGAKQGGRKNRRKNRKNRKQHAVPKTYVSCTAYRVGKSKKKSATATKSSGSVKKLRTCTGKNPRLKKAQKRHKEQRKSERENAERKKWLENWLASEMKRESQQAIDGLVGLMEGFEICAGEKVQEKTMVEGEQEGVVDMDKLEMQMAMLGVMGEDGGETL